MPIEYECPNCGTLNVPFNLYTEAIKCRCGKTLIVLNEVDGTLLVEEARGDTFLPRSSKEDTMTTFNSANTSDWLEVMKNQSISSVVPSNYCIAETPIFTSGACHNDSDNGEGD